MRKNKDDILPNIIFDEEDDKSAVKNSELSSDNLESDKIPLTEETKEETKKEPIEEQPKEVLPKLDKEIVEEIIKPIEYAEPIEKAEFLGDKNDILKVEECATPTQVVESEIYCEKPISQKQPNMLARINYERFTKIVSNIAIFLSVLTVLMKFSFALSLILWVAAIIVVFLAACLVYLFTLGTIHKFAPDFVNGIGNLLVWVLNSPVNFFPIAISLYNSANTVGLVALVFAITALVCNFTLKRKKSVGRIVFLFIFLQVVAICLCIYWQEV